MKNKGLVLNEKRVGKKYEKITFLWFDFLPCSGVIGKE